MIDRTTEATTRFLMRAPTARGTAVKQGGGAAALPLSPGVRDMWSRFVIARLMWILLMAVLVTSSASGYVLLQKPMYKAQATVAIYPAAGATSAVQPFVMGTEKGVVSSGAVLSLASQSLLIPVSKLQSGLSITVPVDSDLLVIAYTDRNPQVAQSAAEAIAEAYVAYRTTALGPAAPKTGSSSTASLQVAVVTDATLPTSPDGPNPLLTIGVALILGLSLGIGLALILDWLDDRLRGAADLQAQAKTALLARIPAFDRKKHGMKDGLIIVEHPDSPIASAYVDLRTRVLQAATLRRARTLLVTSPGSEDKSTVAANLAAAMALSGRRVVLVCADLREGNAHLLFGLKDGLGVTSVVFGDAELADALSTTGVHGLEVLAAGPPSPDPSSVLQSRAFKDMLQMLRAGADMVVIEAPPVLARADAAAMAEEVDMLLLVADARITSRADVRAAVEELGRVRGRMVGCVLDNVGRTARLGEPSRQASTSADPEPVIPSTQNLDPTGIDDLYVPSPVSSIDDLFVPSSVSSIDDLYVPSAVSSTVDAISEPPRDEIGPWNGSTSDLVVEAVVMDAALTTIPARNGAAHHPNEKTKRRRNTGRNET